MEEPRQLPASAAAAAAGLWSSSSEPLERRELDGPRSAVICVAVSLNGKSVAAGTRGTYEDDEGDSEDDCCGGVWIWHLAPGVDGKTSTRPYVPVKVEKAHYGEDVRCVCFAPDGERLASGGGDALVRLRCARSGREERTLAGHAEPVLCLAFAPDGASLASGSEGQVRVWAAAGGACLAAVACGDEAVRCVALSPDGGLLLAGTASGRALVADARTGALLRELAAHSEAVSGAALAPGLLVTAGQDGSLVAWEAATGRERLRARGPPGGVWSLALAAEGRLALCGGDGEALLLALEEEGPRELCCLHLPARAVALSADGRVAAVAGEDTGVVLVLAGPEPEGAPRAGALAVLRALDGEALAGALRALPREQLEALAAAVAAEVAARRPP